SIEARLPDVSRVQMIQPPASRTGLFISIRRFLKEHRSIRDLVTQGSLTDQSLTLLQAAVGLQKNVIISDSAFSIVVLPVTVPPEMM
ncbi:hypothetical protein ACC754_40230, partial [Rhizobium johnstonii]